MKKQGKLELTWVGKDERPRLEPRILIEDPTKSYGDPKAGNMLIFGDNLLALRALEQDFAGQIKCACIDPPYNTGSAFTHYDDGLEHSIWLSLIRDRIEIIHRLLSDYGSLWITIDDTESHYLKVLCDEIFGRQNFIANVVWQKKYSPQNNAIWLSDSHDHILAYAKDKEKWRPLPLPRSKEMDARYKNRDNDPRGPWKASDFTISLTGGQRGAQFARTGFSTNIYEMTTPAGRKLMPTKGRCWAASPEKFKELLADNRLWFGESGNNVPALKRFLSEVQDGSVAKTIWLRDEIGDNQDAKKEVMVFNSQEVFSTPKPEGLPKRILDLATKPDDWVLDSFAGSGTTGAVAHKMGRRWVMVELGKHCHTHIIPRLQKVIDGKDMGGITEAVGWKSGGGFKYYHLAETLLLKDKELGVYVINPKYNAEMLIRAICKIENYRYKIKGRWHGHSSEKRLIHVTTKLLNQKYLDLLASELGDDQSLLIYSTKKVHKLRIPDNIEVKRIPRDLLVKCEFNAEVK